MRLIGSGGMGEVYLGRDTLLDRLVAVKLISSARHGSVARRRFQLEARALARLDHPNVVGVYRAGELEGRPYLVSEYVPGRTLDKIVLPITWQQALPIAIGLARGLAAAHREGVIHRDVKPGNVILAEDGGVKLCDFGLAKPIDDRRADTPETEAADVEPGSATAPGVVPGTPLYLAPELWGGDAASPRTDLYSVGALLFYLCSGRPHHRASTLKELVYLSVNADPPPLATVQPDVDERFAAIVDRLLARDPAMRFATADVLREHLEVLEPDRKSPLAVPEGNPYRGLRAFEAEHRSLFFGRSAEIRALVERLRGDPLVIVAGDSGVGKSSLAKAGVLPAVTDGALGDGRAWSVVSLFPGRKPISALAWALARAIGSTEESIAAQLQESRFAAGTEVRRRMGDARSLIIFVDQLEELITIADPEEARAFSEAIYQLATYTPGVRVLATIRGDYLTRAAALPGFGDDISRTLYILRPLAQAGLREAVVGPARAKGFSFESSEMVDALVAAAGQGAGGLPLLQFAMAELWDKREDAKHVIPAAALEQIGGVEGALARHADAVFSRLLPGQRRAARRMLGRLVTLDGTRARRHERELAEGHADASAALAALVRGRLLVASESEAGAEVEIAHEALIAGWPALRFWLEQDKEHRAILDRLARAVDEWRRAGRSPDALWSKRQLLEASSLEREDLAPREAEFLDASWAAVRRGRAVRIGLLMVTLLAMAAVWGVERREAKRAFEAKIEAHVTRAATELDAARGAGAALSVLRGEALASFDAAKIDEGEARWSQVLVRRKEIDHRFDQASHELEAAQLLDGERAATRALHADLLHARVLWAEESGASAGSALERLALYDQDGARMASLATPARLEVRTDPPDAEITLRAWAGAEWAHEEKLTGGGERTVAPGSYLLVAAAPGRATVRFPFVARRGERIDLRLELPPEVSVPREMVYVPAGRFMTGADGDEALRREFFGAAPLHEVAAGAFLIGRHEVTLAEWIEFLSAQPPDARKKHTPKPTSGTFPAAATMLLEQRPSGWHLSMQPAGTVYRAAAGEPIRYRGRAVLAEQDWRRFPVSAVTIDDVEAYLSWLRATGKVPGARLCTELEWERAARGADGRPYPRGDTVAAEDANFDATYGRKDEAFGPDAVGAHPASDSPFGLSDMAGNVWEMTRSVRTEGEIVAKGGGWYQPPVSAHAANREVVDAAYRSLTVGFRVCAPSLESPR